MASPHPFYAFIPGFRVWPLLDTQATAHTVLEGPREVSQWSVSDQLLARCLLVPWGALSKLGAGRQTSLCCRSPCQGISSLSPEVIKCKIPDLVARWQLHGFLSPGLADWWARQGVVRRTLAVGLSSAVEGEPWGNFEDSGPRQLWTPEKRPAEDNNSQKLTFA